MFQKYRAAKITVDMIILVTLAFPKFVLHMLWTASFEESKRSSRSSCEQNAI